MAGRISAGQLSAFVFYAVIVAGAVATISEVVGDLQRAAGATERVFELLAIEPGIAPPANPVPLPTPARGTVSFDAVTFRYPSRPDTPALDAIHARRDKRRERRAGRPVGRGQDDGFPAAASLLRPAGRRGSDRRRRPAHRGSLRRPGAPRGRAAGPGDLRDERTRECPLRPAGCHARPKFAPRAKPRTRPSSSCELPQGYDSRSSASGACGSPADSGSGSRLRARSSPIGRSCCSTRRRARSTRESERVVQLALERLMARRTVLIIAHRLATVRHADRIVVMDRGRIVAAGTHDELVAGNALYARLAALQFGAGGSPAASAVAPDESWQYNDRFGRAAALFTSNHDRHVSRTAPTSCTNRSSRRATSPRRSTASSRA